MIRFVVVILVGIASCGPGSPGGPNMSSKIGGDVPPPPKSEVISQDILDREPVSNRASVKHILISYKDLGDAFQGRQDQRAQKRSKTDAEREVKALFDQIKGGGDFDQLMKANSEDRGSAQSGTPFTVTPDAQLVIEFRQLSLRLKVNEVGICLSDFGFHIIKRIE
jgi:hypothetical protein